MRSSVLLAVVAVLAVSSACAPKRIVAPVVTTPRFPEFLQPRVPPNLAGSQAVAAHDRAWLFLQAGDLRSAEREVEVALKDDPTFYPAEVTGGYVELARKDARAAIVRFDRALLRKVDDVPALVGKGEALSVLERDAEAVETLQSALAADRTLTEVQRHVDVLKFRVVQREVATAREAARAGRLPEAIQTYRTAIERSPDTAFLYRELAISERAQGDTERAMADFRKARELDPADALSIVQIAELQEAAGELQPAIETYGDALAIDPNPDVEARRDALRARLDLAKLPAQYRAIDQAPQLTRGDLAALVGVRLGELLQSVPPRDVGVITDIRGHWAEPWILLATRASILDAFANHTFEPNAVILRGDVAEAVTRLLARVAVAAPAEARRWTNARGQFSDLTPTHLAYAAASTAVASGVMRTTADGAFQPMQRVTGAEAVAAIEALRAMVARAVAGGR